MDCLIKIENTTDIPAQYRQTPIGLLLEYHNLGRPFETYAQAQLLIGHTKCGMVNLAARKEVFIRGLVENAGWEEAHAEEHFRSFAALFEIGNEIDFTLSEAPRLRARYPKIIVAPMLYRVEDNRLYLLAEK